MLGVKIVGSKKNFGSEKILGNSISRIDPIGNEYKVQISYLYRLGLVFSFGVPHLHLYIYMYIYIDGDAGRQTRKQALVDINN